jgi:two-component system sensor histidine kinase DesK
VGISRWRRTSSIWLVYLAYAVSDLFSGHASSAKIVLALVLIAAFCWLYIVVLPRAMFAAPNRDFVLVLTGAPTITVVYLALVGPGGLLFSVYLGVMFTVLLVPAISLPVVLAMAAAVTWLPRYVPGWDMHHAQWAISGPILLVVFALFMIRSGIRNQIELHQARQEIERLAQEQERLRISRDLHDLLGHALTTITVKAELASRLAARNPERAAAEMAEVAALGREGLADVRAAVAGYRQVSLVTELAAAREVLAAAGISAELPAAVEDVPVERRELFGWVLREGVTNVVRHSGASAVRVTVMADSIEIVDDGAGEQPAPEPDGRRPRRRRDAAPTGVSGGNGLAGLAERVSAAGGQLETGPAAPATNAGFRLRAVVPA